MDRSIIVNGPAFKRGQLLGQFKGSSIKTLLNHKLKSNAAISSEQQTYLLAAKKNLEKYTPVCYEELCGLSQTIEIELASLLYLSCEYELWMENSRVSEKCTGFITTKQTSQKNDLIMGQTNDESPEEWLGGSHDFVCHHTDDKGLRTLIYTHPGIPAYMGMNSAGLVMLWQYIDNGERNLMNGIPTTALIREALTYTHLRDALQFIESVPRAVPNNYILGQSGVGGVNIECTPTIFHKREIKKGSFCHANHILTHEKLKAQDISRTRTSSTSQIRQEAIESLVPQTCSELSVEKAKKVLTTSPVFYDRTLAAMVFAPMVGEMHICFKDSPRHHFLVCRI